MQISMARGDIKWFRFMVQTPYGDPSELDFTSVYFTVKPGAMSPCFLFRKSLKDGTIYRIGKGDYQLKIDAADTEKLSFGCYKFDIQITYKDLLKKSFVGDFILTEEITRPENEEEDDGSTDFELPDYDEPEPEEPQEIIEILEIPDYHVLEIETPVAVKAAADYLDLANRPSINGVELAGNLSSEDLNLITNVDWEDVDNAPTTVEGYGITDAVTQTELQELLENFSGVYRYRGQLPDLDALAAIENPADGDIYDIADSGVNYAWNAAEERWDSLGGAANVASLSDYELDMITGSASSAASFAALIANGGTVTLDNNIALPDGVTITRDTVIDLCGFTLSSTAAHPVLHVDRAKLTVIGGTMHAADCCIMAENGAEITLKNVLFTGGTRAMVSDGLDTKITVESGSVTGTLGAALASNGGSFELKGGQIAGTDGPAIETAEFGLSRPSRITIRGGNIIARTSTSGKAACGILLNGQCELSMFGGSIVSIDGCGLLVRAGDAVINDGTIIAQGDNSGYVGDNGTRMSPSAIIYHQAAYAVNKPQISLVINGGSFSGSNLALEIISSEAHPAVEVHGGTFTPSI